MSSIILSDTFDAFSPASHDANHLPSAFEVRHILLDHTSVNQMNQSPFDGVAVASIRHLSFAAQNIKRIKYELDRHHQEEQELFEHLMKYEEFRETLQPTVYAH
jgi:hypothetical protein